MIWEEATRHRVREQHPRALVHMALWQRHRRCTGALVWKNPWALIAVWCDGRAVIMLIAAVAVVVSGNEGFELDVSLNTGLHGCEAW